MENLIVRKYNAEDGMSVEALLQKDQEYHIAGNPDLFVPTDKFYPDSFYEDLEEDDQVFAFIAEVDKKIAGCIICSYSEYYANDQIHQNNILINDICVLDEYKRKGVATALYNAVLTKAEEELMDFIILEVYDFNSSAEEFYKSVGMKDNRKQMSFLVTPKSDKRLISKERYNLEHIYYRDSFFDNKQFFVNELSREALFIKYSHYFGRVYDRHSFNYEVKKKGEYNLAILTLPKEEIHLLCRKIVYFYTDDYDDYGMFTIEYDEKCKGYYLCEWRESEEEYVHCNHGEVSGTDGEQLARIEEILAERAKNNDTVLISTVVSGDNDNHLSDIEAVIEVALEANDISYSKDDDEKDLYSFVYDFDGYNMPFFIFPHEDYIEFSALTDGDDEGLASGELLKFMDYLNSVIRFIKFRSLGTGIVLTYEYLFDEGNVLVEEISEIIQRIISICSSYHEYMQAVIEGNMTAVDAIERMESEE